MTSQCLAHGLSCLTVLATGNQVVVKREAQQRRGMIFCDDIVPTCLQAERYHSTIHHSLLLDCSPLVVLCCVAYCLFYCDTVQCVHTFYITVREMPCMGRSYCPVRIFPLWAIVCMHSNKGSNKVVKLN